LDNGAEWKPLSVTPEQAQFLETRGFTDAQICSQMFLVSPSWFGTSTARSSNITYQNVEQDGERLAQFTCARWVVRVEKAISDLLPQPQYAKFNMDALKRGALTDRSTYLTAALDPVTGWMERSEARDLEDLGRDPRPKQPTAPVVPLTSVPSSPPAAAAN
jgi:phage portal protein BeeE